MSKMVVRYPKKQENHTESYASKMNAPYHIQRGVRSKVQDQASNVKLRMSDKGRLFGGDGIDQSQPPEPSSKRISTYLLLDTHPYTLHDDAPRHDDTTRTTGNLNSSAQSSR